jgi:hypothetical protein
VALARAVIKAADGDVIQFPGGHRSHEIQRLAAADYTEPGHGQSIDPGLRRQWAMRRMLKLAAIPVALIVNFGVCSEHAHSETGRCRAKRLSDANRREG